MIPAWHPRAGETVHLRPGNQWQLPAARYTLHHESGAVWSLHGKAGDACAAAPLHHLQAAMEAGTLTPISAAELAREAQEVTLRQLAPLRGNRRGPMRAQHDCSDLALFSAGTAPTLF